MKTFIATYESPCNIFKGKICLPATNIEEAQNRFFLWLKRQETYKHMWKLMVEFEEVESV